MTPPAFHKRFKDALRLRNAGRNRDARELLLELASSRPENPKVSYACACVHDALGLEHEAIPFYERSIALGLAGKDLEDALLGLGSSYRCVGRYARAIKTLARGQERFPKSKKFAPFLAMAYFNAGKARRAMELVLRCLAETSRDPGIMKYRRAIEFYADKLDKTW